MDKVFDNIKRLDSSKKDRSDESTLTDPGVATLENYNNYNNFETVYPSFSNNDQFPDTPPPAYNESVSESTRAYNYNSYHPPPNRNPAVSFKIMIMIYS